MLMALSCFVLVSLFAAAQGEAPRSRNPSQAKLPNTATSSSAEGERLFQTNCGRCHNPPEELSPREVRAVLRHMRVRAMLTAEEEKSIREYLAP